MRVDLLFPAGLGGHRGADAAAAPGSVPEHFKDLRADLQLDDIVAAMAGGDQEMAVAIVAALAQSATNNAAIIGHRQAVLADAMANPEQFTTLYRVARQSARGTSRSGRGLLGDSSAAIASAAVNTLTEQVATLAKLRDVLAAGHWDSPAMRDLAEQAGRDLDPEYLAELAAAVGALRPGGTLVASARLGWGNEGSQYVLRRPEREPGRRWPRLGRAEREIIRFDERDDSAAQSLAQLRDDLTSPIAGLLRGAAENITRFLADLAEQSALYVGALNLARETAARGIRTTVPLVSDDAGGIGQFTGLVDLALALRFDGPVVANTLDAGQARAVIVTGANQGGKSTFLRSLGQAQLMAQAGLQVAAQQWTGYAGAGLFTHFTREEDRSMRSGRLDDELARLDGIVSALRSGSMLLSNESLSSTNEREGSALAEQVVGALIQGGVRVVYVTHLYEFAAAVAAQPGYLLLRAPRSQDGSRSFRLEVGPPTQTSYGLDLYDQIIGSPG